MKVAVTIPVTRDSTEVEATLTHSDGGTVRIDVPGAAPRQPRISLDVDAEVMREGLDTLDSVAARSNGGTAASARAAHDAE